MTERDSLPPCPCCADRLSLGALFQLRPATDDDSLLLCSLCTTTGAPSVPPPVRLASLLAPASAVALRWDLRVHDVPPLAAEVMDHTLRALDAVAAATPPLTWEATCGILCAADGTLAAAESSLTFPAHVSAEKELRDACTEADRQMSAFGVEQSARKDVYEVIKAYGETAEAKALTGERARYLERSLRDSKRLGLHLDTETAEEVKGINARISELGITFAKNLGEEDTKFVKTAQELLGMPADWMKARRVSDTEETYHVSLKYPDYVPLMERCSVPATRQQMEAAYNSRCMEKNGPILEELVQLRHTKAGLLGFETHAEFITSIRMSGSASKVKSFLDDLATKLAPLLAADLEKLRARKSLDGLADPISASDRTYYQKRVEEEEFDCDHERLKQYFPVETVTAGLLAIYQELLGLVFERAPEMEGAAAWHPEVVAYKVTDATDSQPVGFFYLDLHPRAGKYGHAACFGLQPSCLLDATRQLPVAAAVCNFPAPTDDAPALLSHREVETFFHEFGHVMHQLCSLAELPVFAGTAVERDFVEAPSQMLENWCWQPEALRRMSGHHASGAPIPEDLLAALIRSRNANSGLLNMRQIVLGTFDQHIHTRGSAELAESLSAVSSALMRIPTTPKTNMAASFGHLAGGYDAQYYGYMWSDVYSDDMFASRFLKEGIFNPETGADYRREVLSVGGSRDALESLRVFLGREPIVEPFLAAKGLSVG